MVKVSTILKSGMDDKYFAWYDDTGYNFNKNESGSYKLAKFDTGCGVDGFLRTDGTVIIDSYKVVSQEYGTVAFAISSTDKEELDIADKMVDKFVRKYKALVQEKCDKEFENILKKITDNFKDIDDVIKIGKTIIESDELRARYVSSMTETISGKLNELINGKKTGRGIFNFLNK